MFSALTRVTEFKCFVVTSLFPRYCLIREVPSSVSLMAIVFNCATSTTNLSTLQVIVMVALHGSYDFPLTPLPVLRHTRAISDGRLSETWFQTDSIYSYMCGIIQERLPYSLSKNLRHLMHNTPLQIRVRLVPGVTKPISGPSHQLDATFKVAFARTATRACAVRRRETDRASTRGLRCTARREL